jgi:hypothetical protein
VIRKILDHFGLCEDPPPRAPPPLFRPSDPATQLDAANAEVTYETDQDFLEHTPKSGSSSRNCPGNAQHSVISALDCSEMRRYIVLIVGFSAGSGSCRRDAPGFVPPCLERPCLEPPQFYLGPRSEHGCNGTKHRRWGEVPELPPPHTPPAPLSRRASSRETESPITGRGSASGHIRTVDLGSSNLVETLAQPFDVTGPKNHQPTKMEI